jgi:hypothetical protein
MTSRVFHANLEPFVFAFLWYRAVALNVAFSVQHTSQHYHQLVQMLRFTFSILLFASPISTFACEGDCIIGITHALLGNYTSPVYSVLRQIVRYRATVHRPLLTFCRPSRFHENCSPLAMIQWNTWTPSRRPTMTAHTTV